MSFGNEELRGDRGGYTTSMTTGMIDRPHRDVGVRLIPRWKMRIPVCISIIDGSACEAKDEIDTIKILLINTYIITNACQRYCCA